MTELDDLLEEGRAAIARMDPPGGLWEQALERAHADVPSDLDLIEDRRRRPPSRWLAAAAVAACMVALVAIAVLVTRDDGEVVTSRQPEPTTTTTGEASSLLAKGEDLQFGSLDPSPRRTLDVDAEEHAGAVSGTFQVDGVVVAIECADTETSGDDLILGGTVTEDPGGQGLEVFDGTATVGDLVALVIRERAGFADRVTLQADWGARSCADLVISVPYNLDGGFFQDVDADIETGRLGGGN